MSKQRVIQDERERELNQEALVLLDRVVELIQKGLGEDNVKVSVSDYLRALDTRIGLLSRLRREEPQVLEVRYVEADWEKEESEDGVEEEELN